MYVVVNNIKLQINNWWNAQPLDLKTLSKCVQTYCVFIYLIPLYTNPKIGYGSLPYNSQPSLPESVAKSPGKYGELIKHFD